jgi:hypothetical protein
MAETFRNLDNQTANGNAKNNNHLTSTNSLSKVYRLKIDVSGFDLNEIRVSVIAEKIKSENPKLRNKFQVKLTAKKNQKSSEQETLNEYSKLCNIQSKSNIDISSLRYYLDPKDSRFLFIDFNSDENETYVTQTNEDSLKRIADGLVNAKNIDDIKHCLNDSRLFDEIKPNTYVNELNKICFTPIQLVTNEADGCQHIQVGIKIPHTIKPANIIYNKENSNRKTNKLDKTMPNIIMSFDGLMMYLEAVATDGCTSSSFTKELKLPKGTQVNDVKFNLEESKNVLVVQAPYISNE